jgi:hypothetical protein
MIAFLDRVEASGLVRSLFLKLLLVCLVRYVCVLLYYSIVCMIDHVGVSIENTSE